MEYLEKYNYVLDEKDVKQSLTPIQHTNLFFCVFHNYICHFSTLCFNQIDNRSCLLHETYNIVTGGDKRKMHNYQTMLDVIKECNAIHKH